MEIVTRNIVRFLVQKKLLDQDAVVAGGLAVSMSRSRNRFVRVTQRGGPGFFIKQAIATEPMSIETVKREAEIYRGAFGDERLVALRELLPAFHDFDEGQNILVVQLVDDAENVAEHHRRLRRCPPDLARRLGEAIAGYHRIRFEPGKPQAALFPQKPPWICDLHVESDVSRLRRSRAASALTDLLLEAHGLAAHLAAIREDWQRDTLIHTDMKWENCLLAPRKAAPEQQRLLVIDWELADIGDAAWDAAGILQAYVNFWIGSMSANGGTSPDALLANAALPIDDVQAAISSFWDGYVQRSAAYRPVTDAFLDRCVRMMAARMLISAYEMSAHVEVGDPRLLLVLQIAFNVFENPRQAAGELLGIRRHQVPDPMPAAPSSQAVREQSLTHEAPHV